MVRKMIPSVRTVINAGLDFAETKIIGNCAYNLFFKGDFSTDDNTQNDINFSDSFDLNAADRIIDVEFTETTAEPDRK